VIENAWRSICATMTTDHRTRSTSSSAKGLLSVVKRGDTQNIGKASIFIAVAVPASAVKVCCALLRWPTMLSRRYTVANIAVVSATAANTMRPRPTSLSAEETLTKILEATLHNTVRPNNALDAGRSCGPARNMQMFQNALIRLYTGLGSTTSAADRYSPSYLLGMLGRSTQRARGRKFHGIESDDAQ